MEDADQPAAVLLDQRADHEAFAGRTFRAVGRLRSGDHGIGVDGGRLRRKKANAADDVGAIGRLEISFEEISKPRFDFLATVSMNSAHVGEIRVFGKGHCRGVRVMVAETFVEIGERLPDRRGVGVSGLR